MKSSPDIFKGMTVMFLCIDLALFFNQYVNPIALDSLHWKYYIFYCIWLAAELVVVYVFYIETRNTPLEEIAKHFDGNDALIGGGAADKMASHELELGHIQKSGDSMAIEHIEHEKKRK
jgi:hypothetical protein